LRNKEHENKEIGFISIIEWLPLNEPCSLIYNKANETKNEVITI
jgi:hypothetical protein